MGTKFQLYDVMDEKDLKPVKGEFHLEGRSTRSKNGTYSVSLSFEGYGRGRGRRGSPLPRRPLGPRQEVGRRRSMETKEMTVREVGYDNTWACIMAWIWAKGIGQAKIMSQAEAARLLNVYFRPEGVREVLAGGEALLVLKDPKQVPNPYVMGSLSAIKHFLGRHATANSAPPLMDVGEPCQ
jgi:hypothetical protein